MAQALAAHPTTDLGVLTIALTSTAQAIGIPLSAPPTILFEAGHYPDDYHREKTRKYVAMAMMEALQYIATNKVTGAHYEDYFSIPENAKCFFDVILRGNEG